MDFVYLSRIFGMTLAVTLTSTVISVLVGFPLGFFLAKESKIAKSLRSFVSALTGLPPVVAGLCVYFLITRNGPLGKFHLLYSPAAMVMAQLLIVLPIVSAAIYPAFARARHEFAETCAGLRLSRGKIFWLLLRECRFACVSAMMSGYGRAISEVGAVMLVGGNIAGKTRVMTTAVLTETGRGNYAQAMLLGGMLLAMSIVINLIASKLRGNVT